MTPAQGERLWEVAAATRPGGAIVEIGSYRGKSAIVLASAAPDGVSVTAIDPHAGNDRGPQQIHGHVDEGEADHAAFLANLSAAGVADRVRHVRLPSHDAVVRRPRPARRLVHRRRPPPGAGPRRSGALGCEGR